ncbi:hypothetical protein D3C76_903820 [compost metagenome]
MPDLCADLIEYLLGGASVAVAAVQFHVEQRIAQERGAVPTGLGMEVDQPLIGDGVRQGRPGLVMFRDTHQAGLGEAPLLEQHPGEFGRPPGQFRDARNLAVFSPGQDVMQAMAELMKEDAQLPMIQQHRVCT